MHARQIDDLREENARLTSRKDELCREMDECNRLLSELQSEKSAMQEENKGVHEKNDELTKDVATLEGGRMMKECRRRDVIV